MSNLRRSFFILSLCAVIIGAHADDTDVYLNPSVPSGAEPQIMFTLDYRSNLGSTACSGTECDSLIAEGYMAATGPYTFFDVLRGALKKVLDPLDGVKVGFMMNHSDSCTGKNTSGPGVTKCSNGAYVLYGLTTMSAGTDDAATFQRTGEDPAKLALFDKLDAIPTPGGTLNHSYQGKEVYFELFRYLTGQGIYNGHLGFTDFGDTDKNTNLDVDFPAISWDTSIESGTNYVSPLIGANCTKTYALNFLFQVSNQEDDSDSAILDTKAFGGMAGINLSGKNNSFDTVIEYLNDVDLGDGTFGTVGVLDGTQNVISYFLVDPTKINTTTTGYATAGGTGIPLEFSDDPDALVDTLNNIFNSILSISTTFVAPSVPVNVFNRAQIVDEVFLALFEADENGLPFWNGNLKKLRIGSDINGNLELQDVNGLSAIDIDGRVRRDALTLWTDPATLPAAEDDEVEGKDGRAVARGGAGQQIPGYVSGSPGLTNAATGARQLFTEDPTDLTDGLMALNADATTASALWTEITQNWSPAASSATYAGATAAEKTKAVNILKWARGLQDDNSTRNWLLGDPLHSRPRPINYGARTGAYSDTNPDIGILMGANDGFVHMFRNTGAGGVQLGTELWGYMPRAVIPQLDRLRSNTGGTPVHPILVDGSAVTYTTDVDNDGTIETADGDAVIAMIGLRRGGKGFYALDVSDPDTPKFKWKIEKGTAGSDYAEMGQSWATANVGNLLVNGVNTPVFVIGGGYNGDDDGDNAGDLGKDAKNRSTRAGATPSVGTDDDEGNAIFVGNLDTGALIWKATFGTSTAYNAINKTLTDPNLKDSFADALIAADTDGNGYLDRAYAGDTGGVLWRVDFGGLVDHDSDAATADILVIDDPQHWQITRVLSVGRHSGGTPTIANDRRFLNQPDIAQTRDATGAFDAVIIGSGDREDPNGELVSNRLYVYKDRNTAVGAPPTTVTVETDLEDITTSCVVETSCTLGANISNGWYLQLTSTGEKNLAPALTAGGNVFFTTFTPATASGTCSLSEGSGRLYAVSLQNGSAQLDFNSSNNVTASDGSTTVVPDRADELGSGGIPVQVVPLGGGKVLAQGQEVGENIVDTGGQTSFKTYWHESYQ